MTKYLKSGKLASSCSHPPYNSHSNFEASNIIITITMISSYRVEVENRRERGVKDLMTLQNIKQPTQVRPLYYC